MTYRWHGELADVRIAASRGYDHRESFGYLLYYSRRDADASVASTTVEHRTEQTALGLRLEWRRSHIVRTSLFAEGLAPEFDDHAISRWAAARFERRIAGGWASASVGGGNPGIPDHWDWAPEVSYRFVALTLTARVGFERVLEPVWSDLASFQSPFLQSTWAGVMELRVARTSTHAGVTTLVGSTTDRAIVYRHPLDELWLRPFTREGEPVRGFRADTKRYDFRADHARRRLGVATVRPRGRGSRSRARRAPISLNVDPPFGARGIGEVRMSAFKGDLGIIVRGEVDAVGPQESQVGSHEITAFVTSGASLAFTLADAIFTLRIKNLEDKPRPQPWLDWSTDTEALGPGREVRLGFTLRLFN